MSIIPKQGEIWEFRSLNNWEKLLICSNPKAHGYSESMEVCILDSNLQSMIGTKIERLYWPQDASCWNKVV